MTRPALALALRGLLNTCAAAALLVASGCAVEPKDDGADDLGGDDDGCNGGWFTTELSIDADGTIVALSRGLMDSTLLLLEEGIFVRIDDFGTETSESLPGTGLREFVELDNGDRLVVGAGGQVIRAANGSSEWAVIDAGISEDLIDIAAAGNGAWAVAIASNRVLYSSDRGLTWTDIVAPGGNWSGLRRVLAAGGAVWLIGDGGQAWMTGDPSNAGDPWASVDLGSSADLLSGGALECTGCAMMVSADTLHIRDGGSWTTIPAPEGEEFVSAGDGYVATDAGLYRVGASPTFALSRVVSLSFSVSAIVESSWDEIRILGANGEFVGVGSQSCLGRPWMIAGAPRTATVADNSDLAGAEGWARDGLYEHASVASFARFIGDLLALGAPPELVRAAQAAILDELEHARLCFELAAREHGPIAPGPLPLARSDEQSKARAGDPIGFMLALFDEGCVGETIAALDASVAAAETEDLDARRALEQIAADEAQHAALAWRTLRWLIERFGEPVRESLRRRVACTAEGGSEIRRRAVNELIAPLAAAMLRETEGVQTRGSMAC